MVLKPRTTLSHDLAITVRVNRERQGMSLGDAARRSGLSKTILSKIEAGEANPSLETLGKLGHAMGLSVGELLSPSALGSVRVLRAEEGSVVKSSSGVMSRLLLANSRQYRTEVFECTIPPNARLDADPHYPGAEELVVCIGGPLEVGPLDRPVVLEAGDSALFPVDVPHSYAAGDAGGKALILVSFPNAAEASIRNQKAGP